MIDKLIKDTLDETLTPVSKIVHRGNETTYITFNTYLQKSELEADDESIAEGYYIQVDVFSKANYKALVTKVKDLMKDEGFIRIDEKEFYEKDTQLFHKALRFSYTKGSV